MKNKKHGLSEREMEHAKLLMADSKMTGDVQAKLKRLFAGTIEQMLEAEMDEHLDSICCARARLSSCGRNIRISNCTLFCLAPLKNR